MCYTSKWKLQSDPDSQDRYSQWYVVIIWNFVTFLTIFNKERLIWYSTLNCYNVCFPWNAWWQVMFGSLRFGCMWVSVTSVWELLWEPIYPMLQPSVWVMYYGENYRRTVWATNNGENYQITVWAMNSGENYQKTVLAMYYEKITK